ncbi:hypothetical protein GGS24DRAFT_506156 [Hypoxylon argillaceum]|nr:hypothetical protein GGS24DRAFT_506156 [Hypoxylon argillaceum]
MANPRETKQDILDSLELINGVFADVDGRIHINSMERVLSPAEEGLRLLDRDVCEIVASFPDGTLYSYLIKNKDGSVPRANLSRLIVEHRQLGGECLCFLKPSQLADRTGNLSQHLEALEKQCEGVSIDLTNISPLLRFLLLCRISLRLPLPGRFGLLRAANRFDEKTWLGEASRPRVPLSLATLSSQLIGKHPNGWRKKGWRGLRSKLTKED